MKAILLLSFLLTLTTTTFSQINKGHLLIGGNLSFESTTEKGSFGGTTKSSNIFISPGLGYFIIDKGAMGVRIDFRSYSSMSSHTTARAFGTRTL